MSVTRPHILARPARRSVSSCSTSVRNHASASEGEFVTTRWTATGTRGGTLMGIPPTNRRAVTHGCTVGQFKNGKSVHDWIYWDTANLLRQLGVTPGAK
jgi:predicted ester cyclase